MEKKCVFISHINEEREIAIALKKLLDQAFLGMIDVFVSSDPRSLPAGEKWLSRITQALQDCAVEIIIASPRSVARPWINFEAGAGYVRDVPVIPFCHSGMFPDKLPKPLCFLQAVVATDSARIKQILPVLAKSIGCGVPENVPIDDFAKAVKIYENTSEEIANFEQRTEHSFDNDLKPHELAALVTIAEEVDVPEAYVYSRALPREYVKAGFTNFALKIAMAKLCRLGLLEMISKEDRDGDLYYLVKITLSGWEQLELHQETLVVLNNDSNDRNEDATNFGDYDEGVPF